MDSFCTEYEFIVYGVFALKQLSTSRYPKTFFIDLHMQVYMYTPVVNVMLLLYNIIKCQKDLST